MVQEMVSPPVVRTEKARDQALEDLKRHTCNILKEHGREAKFRKVNR